MLHSTYLRGYSWPITPASIFLYPPGHLCSGHTSLASQWVSTVESSTVGCGTPNGQPWFTDSSEPLPTLYSFPYLFSHASDVHHRLKLSLPSPNVPFLLLLIGIALNNSLASLIPPCICSSKDSNWHTELIVSMILKDKLRWAKIFDHWIEQDNGHFLMLTEAILVKGWQWESDSSLFKKEWETVTGSTDIYF